MKSKNEIKKQPLKIWSMLNQLIFRRLSLICDNKISVFQNPLRKSLSGYHAEIH